MSRHQQKENKTNLCWNSLCGEALCETGITICVRFMVIFPLMDERLRTTKSAGRFASTEDGVMGPVVQQ